MCRIVLACCCRFINALAEPAEDVAAFLVPRIRAVVQEGAANPLTGAAVPTYTRFLTKPGAFSKIFAKLAGANRDRYVKEES